jgi:hypothetical protein
MDSKLEGPRAGLDVVKTLLILIIGSIVNSISTATAFSSLLFALRIKYVLED